MVFFSHGTKKKWRIFVQPNAKEKRKLKKEQRIDPHNKHYKMSNEIFKGHENWGMYRGKIDLLTLQIQLNFLRVGKKK